MCFPFDNIEPTTEQGKKSVRTLQFLAAAEVVIALLKMFVFKDILGGFYELLSCMILWMAWAQLSFCLCLLYVIYICIMGSITYTVNLLTPIQNGKPFFGESGLQHIVVTFTLIFLAFYIVASYISFLAYKEFKAIQYEMGAPGGILGGIQPGAGGNGQSIGGANFSQNRNNDYGANVNYGGIGGGDTEAYFPPVSSNNLNQAAAQQQSNNQGRGGGGQTQYFQGKGVLIG